MGDNAANTITLTDEGGKPNPASALFTLPQLTVTADGETTVFPRGVAQRVVVLALGGDDSVTYHPVEIDGPQGVRSVSVNLGSGDDTAEFAISRPLEIDGNVGLATVPLNVDLTGGPGDDVATVDVGSVTEAALSFRANLGAGDDTLAAAFAGPMINHDLFIRLAALFVQGGQGNDGIDLEANGTNAEGYRFEVVLQGGAGDDAITAGVNLTGDVQSAIRLRVYAGDGDDQVTVDLTNQILGTSVVPLTDAILLDGGSGDDNITLTAITKRHPSRAMVRGGSGFDIGQVSTPFKDIAIGVTECETLF